MIERHPLFRLRHRRPRVAPDGPIRTPRSIALPASVNAFRLPGSGADPAWFGDDMGGTADPDDPRLTRRDFLIRTAVAGGAVAVGGAINLLTTALTSRLATR